MRRAPALSVLAGLLLAALVLGVVEAPAEAKLSGKERAAFNVAAPWGTDKQRWRLLRGVDAAIAKVPARSKKHPAPTIHIATFMLDRERTVDRLIAACRRGVSVRVILDDDVISRQARRLREVLNADNVRDRDRNGRADRGPRRGPCDTRLPAEADKKDQKKAAGKKGKNGKKHRGRKRRPKPLPLQRTWGSDRSYVKTCDGACRGPGWNMHSKFYVFSVTGPYRDVVKLGSSNLNSGGALKGWNDMYTVRDRRKLYVAFRRMHRAMTLESRARAGLVQVRSGRYLVRFYPLRKAGERRDPVVHDLQRIGCRTPLGRTNRTKVFVSMFYWKGRRGEYLADRLIGLGRRGCKVQVVMGAPSKKVAGKLRRASRRRTITAYDSRWDLNADGVVDKRTHAKFVLVKGRYGRDLRAFQVMTGSGNWVKGSLAGGDEVSINISGKGTYKAYVKAWDRIRDHSRVMGRW